MLIFAIEGRDIVFGFGVFWKVEIECLMEAYDLDFQDIYIWKGDAMRA
jgi:hypothetical protein